MRESYVGSQPHDREPYHREPYHREPYHRERYYRELYEPSTHGHMIFIPHMPGASHKCCGLQTYVRDFKNMSRNSSTCVFKLINGSRNSQDISRNSTTHLESLGTLQHVNLDPSQFISALLIINKISFHYNRRNCFVVIHNLYVIK